MYYVTTWVNGTQVLTGPFTLIEAKEKLKASAKSALKSKIIMLLKLREITTGELDHFTEDDPE